MTGPRQTAFGEITVRGNATAEEVAAVLAMVASRRSASAGQDEMNPYEQWRRRRIDALRRSRDAESA